MEIDIVVAMLEAKKSADRLKLAENPNVIQYLKTREYTADEKKATKVTLTTNCICTTSPNIRVLIHRENWKSLNLVMLSQKLAAKRSHNHGKNDLLCLTLTIITRVISYHS
jgi:hypothetical protein